MDVFEAIGKRHSYRGEYGEEPVSRRDLEKIVDAGIRAPSGYNDQTTSFVIVDDSRLIEAIAEIVDNAGIGRAKAIIAVVMDPVGAGRDFNFGIEDYSAAVENMLIAVTALGFASVWIDGALRRESRAERIGELLGIPESLPVRVILPVGVPAERGEQRPRKPFGKRAWFNRYGSE